MDFKPDEFITILFFKGRPDKLEEK